MSKKQKNIEVEENKKKKKTKKKHRGLKAFLFIILMIVLFFGGFFGYSVYKNGWGLKGILQTALGQDEEFLQELDEFRVLILGVSEDISAELTDTIMVASYNPRTQKAVLLSIPRDTYVGTNKSSANSYDKINALYQKGGAEATLEAVNEITGLDIKYYVVISNNALVELVDEIGGVEFDVPIDMDYDSKKQDLHIHLSKGLQTLTGEQAEWLVRFRHNNNGTSYSSEYGDNDYGRMRTQREFLKAVANQTLKLKNITKIGSLIDIVKENVTTNITDWTMVKDYIPYAVEFSTDNLETATIPGESKRIPAKTGLWFFEYSETETKELIDELYTEQNASDAATESDGEESQTVSLDKSEIKLEIINASGDSTLLTKVTNLLKEKGYNVYKTGTGTGAKASKTTIVNKSNLSSDIMNELKDVLGNGTISSELSTTTSVDITITLGKDFSL